MASAVKRKLSGSTDGKAIKVVQTGTAGDTVHTAVAGTTPGTFDEIWLFAVNSSAAAVKLTIEWGTADAPDGNIEQTIPPESGLVLIVPGLILQNGMVVKAFAASANVVMIHGYVNSITD
jgi:uncharacterized membrane protein YjjP (DUF1212 family)